MIVEPTVSVDKFQLKNHITIIDKKRIVNVLNNDKSSLIRNTAKEFVIEILSHNFLHFIILSSDSILKLPKSSQIDYLIFIYKFIFPEREETNIVSPQANQE